MKLTDYERQVLFSFLAAPDNLHNAIKKFCGHQERLMENFCADNMRRLPRNYEQAADFAAKAEVYRTLFTELERFAEHE